VRHILATTRTAQGHPTDQSPWTSRLRLNKSLTHHHPTTTALHTLGRTDNERAIGDGGYRTQEAPTRTRSVALVYDCIYPYITGGAERRFYEFGKRLLDERTEVHLYGMKLWDGPSVMVRDGLVLHGIAKARPLYTKRGRRSVKQAALFGAATLRLLVGKFDVIDCCGFPYFSIFSCKLAALLRRKPMYSTWHEAWGRDYWRAYLGRLGLLGYAIEWLAARAPDEIIAVSEHTKSRLVNQLGVRKPLHVLLDGVDTRAIRSAAPAAETSDIIFVGRLVEYKHVDILLRALARLRERGLYVRCNIIGSGPELQALQQLATVLEVDDRTAFHGTLKEAAEVYRLMKASTILVLPSSREGLGLVVMEANACGLPVITTDCPDNAAADLITQGLNGSVVPLDVQAIATAIEYWLSVKPPDLSTYVANLDWDTLAKSQDEIYFE